MVSASVKKYSPHRLLLRAVYAGTFYYQSSEKFDGEILLSFYDNYVYLLKLRTS